MADGSSYALNMRFFNTETTMLSNRKKETVLLPGMAILTMDTSFTGPFNKNWLFMGAQLRAQNMMHTWMPVPYKPDAVTVYTMRYEGNITIWEVFEDLRGYLAWNSATQALVIMSGGVYGGVVPIRYSDGPHTLITDNFYMTSIHSESVRLVPMVEGRVIAADMEPSSVKVEVEINMSKICAQISTRKIATFNIAHQSSLHTDFNIGRHHGS